MTTLYEILTCEKLPTLWFKLMAPGGNGKLIASFRQGDIQLDAARNVMKIKVFVDYLRCEGHIEILDFTTEINVAGLILIPEETITCEAMPLSFQAKTYDQRDSTFVLRCEQVLTRAWTPNNRKIRVPVILTRGMFNALLKDPQPWEERGRNSTESHARRRWRYWLRRLNPTMTVMSKNPNRVGKCEDVKAYRETKAFYREHQHRVLHVRVDRTIRTVRLLKYSEDHPSKIAYTFGVDRPRLKEGESPLLVHWGETEDFITGIRDRLEYAMIPSNEPNAGDYVPLPDILTRKLED